MNALIRLYDYLSGRRWAVWTMLAILCVVLTTVACRIRFHEDILDFLPEDEEFSESMQVYRSLSEAARIVLIVEGDNPDQICEAIDGFGAVHEQAITELDIASFTDRLDYIYRHLPYFLHDADYDSLTVRLSQLDRWLEQDRRILMMPGSSFLYPSIQHDPLRLIPLSRGASSQYGGAQSSFTSYDGYMMTADCRIGFAFYDSPYGSTETNRNASLVDSLQHTVDALSAQYPALSIRLLGAPVIAVGNARQIKQDSIMAIVLSAVLIVLLLLYAFPRKRDILLIVITVSFGWLCGLAALSLLGQPSLIVVGIGAILTGIAVNYPLHLVVHQRYTTSVRQTLLEVLNPLVVGSITTIGAFAALIPLSSPALRQLGVFASAMFLGAIVFCILFLPHLMTATPAPTRDLPLPHLSPRVQRWLGIALCLLLVCSMYYALSTRSKSVFDANLSSLNYMTPQQRADFAYFESLSPASDEPAYLVPSARAELLRREQLWQNYWAHHSADSVASALRTAAARQGFHEDAFNPFIQLISSEACSSEALASLWPGRFDTQAMNQQITQSITSHFDYLGLVCSIIVFVFLCISFRSIVHGLIAFLPMVVSWGIIYILMMVFDLHFNIVNVILATFIFGQGDDYTIFVLEGHLYEQRTGRKMLHQYTQSIALSALIMLLAIGVLVFAKHPAMHSLGAVTLVGMSSVVICAILLPSIFLRLFSRRF